MDNTSSAPKGARTPWQVTRSVWHAMFMREAISRTMADRMGWFWMIFEPFALVAIMVGIRSFIRGDRLIVNAEFIPWMIAGMMGFFLVREGMLRGMGAIDANSALFAYRQVQPVDPVLVRNFLEGMLRTFVFLLFIVGGLLLGLDMYPDNAIRAMWAWVSLWSLGIGLGLITSVAATLVPEVGRVIRMLSLPLLIISGVMFPLNQLPHWLLEYLMLNPIPHALETLRLGFFENYQVIHGTSMLYFWLVTLSLNALGLLMHLRFVDRLKAK
ncbi:ABC transporter permease [Vreelandella hamiltonii]|uniref:Transport permease protein n=1 Tax=Halomonas johnsoniae TaxID=502832 RepID=A0ABQ2WDS5_9GAMM|nr:ABC transporter permease [Halomonas johnsoniae]KHJ49893.1 ABC transporter permease [Halomonas hydrothermalis]GGW50333.1 transport permease protein [Halomonas johnsoniae]